MRVRLRLRQVVAAASIAAFVLAAAGCKASSSQSPSNGGNQGGKTKADISSLSLSPTQVVAASASKTLQAGSAKVAMTVEVAFSGQTTDITADGAFNFTQHHGTIVMHVPGAGDVPVVYVNSVVYEKLGQLFSSGKPWIKISLTDLVGKSATQSNQGQAESDPSQYVAFLAGASGVTKVGEDSVRGVATTHYHANLDLNKAVSKLPSQFQAFYQAVLNATSSKVRSVFPADMWIDGQGRLRRMSYTITTTTSKGTNTAKTTIDYFSFGAPVSVQVPPADQVTTLPGLGG